MRRGLFGSQHVDGLLDPLLQSQVPVLLPVCNWVAPQWTGSVPPRSRHGPMWILPSRVSAINLPRRSSLSANSSPDSLIIRMHDAFMSSPVWCFIDLTVKHYLVRLRQHTGSRDRVRVAPVTPALLNYSLLQSLLSAWVGSINLVPCWSLLPRQQRPP